MKRISLLFLVFLLCSLGGIVSAQTLIGSNTPLRYYISSAEPDSNWMMPDFDDSNWISDTGSIGYGYFDEDIPVPNSTPSIYLRYVLKIDNPDNLQEMNIAFDHDDGYVLYLNGVEVIRKNIDPAIQFTNNSSVASRSHQRVRFSNTETYGCYIDRKVLDSCNLQVDNSIAIHLLNDTIQGRDLYGKLLVYKIPSNYQAFIFQNWYKRQLSLDSSNLPIVKIITNEFGIPDSDERGKAFMEIINNTDKQYNKPYDSSNVYAGDISIEIRGQSSSGFAKKSYRFELWDSLQKDSNVALLGMPADNDWILSGPFADKAQFRNTMIFDLGRKFNRYQPRTRFCELILNDECVGLYTLTETIKRGNNRIDIARLQQDEISGNDLTGGYIMKYDKPTGQLEITYPKKDKIQPEQENYIRSFMDEYNTSVFSRDFMDPDIGFRKYMSDTSLADHIIMTEFMKNCDGYLYSTYLYKDRADRDNRVKYGTLWDHDLVFGNTMFQEGNLTYGWQFEYQSYKIKFKRILQDPEMVNLLAERWQWARESFLQIDSLFNYIDSTTAYLSEALDRNYYIWPVIDINIFNENYVSQTYEEEIINIKNWISDRLDWIDENIGQIYYEIDTLRYLSTDEYNTIGGEGFFSYELYPNPASDRAALEFYSSGIDKLSIEIFDLNGQIRFASSITIPVGYYTYHIPEHIFRHLHAGIYFVRISNRSDILGYSTLIKQ